MILKSKDVKRKVIMGWCKLAIIFHAYAKYLINMKKSHIVVNKRPIVIILVSNFCGHGDEKTTTHILLLLLVICDAKSNE